MGWFSKKVVMSDDEINAWIKALILEKAPSTTEGFLKIVVPDMRTRFDRCLDMNKGDYELTKKEIRTAYLAG